MGLYDSLEPKIKNCPVKAQKLYFAQCLRTQIEEYVETLMVEEVYSDYEAINSKYIFNALKETVNKLNDLYKLET